MLDGVMRHEDHLGHSSDLGPGDVQWMRAGRGIIHSEMPQQRNGRMRGFQLWINLPASEKMSPAAYRNIEADDIPTLRHEDGTTLRVIAGVLDRAGQAVHGAINPDRSHATDPFLLDLALAPGASTRLMLPHGHQGLIYVFEGGLERIGEQASPLLAHEAGALSNGDLLQLEAGVNGARLLALAARPIGEPVVQYGPFVMNTRFEIDQAIDDYREGRLTAPV
jgi:redox-sensitive bicupin YhaK (pirin superfamily)